MNYQIITLVLFIIFGAIGLYFRIRYDVSTGAVITGKKDDDKTRENAKKHFNHQLIFSILSITFLIISIIQGVLKTI